MKPNYGNALIFSLAESSQSNTAVTKLTIKADIFPPDIKHDVMLPFQKIPQQIMPMFGQNGFGMKLHPFNRERFMPHPHNFVEAAVFILRPGGDFQTIGQSVLLNHQRMIARCGKRIR